MTFVLFGTADKAVHVIPRVPEGQANLEHPLRDLVFAHPEILPLTDLEPGIGRIAAVTVELSLPGAGFADVLLVSEHGRLIIVECKLWRNPQARREVVVQVLDYARELAHYDYEDLQRAISDRLGRTGNVLYELAVAAGSTMTEATFVDRVGRDLRAGRFLLLIVGDGITEGTQRLTEYLNVPGLAFDFGLIEIADYRFIDPLTGSARRILQPRVIARTVTIERHVIRADVPGLSIEAVEPDSAPPRRRSSAGAVGANADSHAAWRGFLRSFIAECQFDDPGQLPPRFGGLNWMRVPLTGPASVTLYRTTSGRVGAFMRFRTAEGYSIFAELNADRDAIADEFSRDDLPEPTWTETDEERTIIITAPAPLPWGDGEEIAQRKWMARAANRFVNSFRPRLLRLSE
jgi:hypothetical protein